MKTFQNIKKLVNGVGIPQLGFGTWQIPNGSTAYDSVTCALKNGYRHIDTANAYGNEESVGKAVRDFGMPREKIFVTSKLPSHIKAYDAALKSFEETMKNLNMEYLDLYLIHAPWPWDNMGMDCAKGNIAAWKAMEKLYKDGRIRAIGVSNFAPENLKPLLAECETVPMVNQISFQIGHRQEETTEFCRPLGMLIEAYSPLATGRTLQNATVREMSERYGVTPAQLCINYCIAKDTVPLPKSTTESRIIENTKLDFTISEADMQILDRV